MKVRFVWAAACVSLAVSAAPPVDRALAAAAPVTAKSAPGFVPGSAPVLAGHKATYDLTLLRTVPGEDVRAARGTMTYVLSDRCDGYTIESNVAMTLSFSNGTSQKVEQRYAAWESKTGRFSSFTMQSLEDGEASKTYRGTITLDADGSGSATYEADKPTTFKLEPGTMLSTAHTLALLRNAAAGKSFFRSHVIDGSFDQGPFLVTALIARAREAGAAVEGKGGAELSAGAYWPMRLAYFPASSTEPVPQYELGMDLLPTGVTRAMDQDFGGFTIGFKLTALEPLKPDC